VARIHAGIYPGICFAEGMYLHVKRIAAKFKMIQRITNQLLLICYRVLLPFTLQVAFPRLLHIGIERATGAESHN